MWRTRVLDNVPLFLESTTSYPDGATIKTMESGDGAVRSVDIQGSTPIPTVNLEMTRSFRNKKKLHTYVRSNFAVYLYVNTHSKDTPGVEKFRDTDPERFEI